LRLEPKELRGAAARVRAEFGPEARIVAADEIRVGGIAGFFAKRMYELLIDHPADWTPPVAPAPQLSGIEALLAQAEELESVLPAVVPVDAPPVSTNSDEFSNVLGALTASVGVSLAEEPPHPARFRAEPGALLVIAGLRDDALRVAADVAASIPGAQLAMSGDVAAALPRVDDRRTATALRAQSVESGGVAIVAIGLGAGGPLAEANASRVGLLGADAVWVAVDATRKHDDTARWVAAVRAAVPVREMAVLDAALTESPESVHDLGLRRVWPDRAR
jgi:hypothetical protein